MRIFATLFTFFAALPAFAHEFWIEPESYIIEPNGRIQARLVNGQYFDGASMGFLPDRFAFFRIAYGSRQGNVENRLGARPALDLAPIGEGLYTARYQSLMARIDYDDWDSFQRFADHKDFVDIEARHSARDLPTEGFTEGYWRFAKTLIAVGDGRGTDERAGLATEFVALDNPYTDDLSAGLRVQLYYMDGIRANAQVELFEKAPDGEVTITLHRTNRDGIASLPVQPGHSYLVDAVVLREPTEEQAATQGIQWETLWASLTFAVPE